MKHPLIRWKNCIEYLEEYSYTSDDELELLNDISVRNTIAEIQSSFTEKQYSELRELDTRFSIILTAALTKAKLLNLYRKQAKNYPVEYWWWHVEER